jgi:hypothetical protein
MQPFAAMLALLVKTLDSLHLAQNPGVRVGVVEAELCNGR